MFVSILDTIVKFDNLVKIDASVKDSVASPSPENIMASRLQVKGVLTAGYAAGESRGDALAVPLAGVARRCAALCAVIAVHFRKWREDQRTWDALAHLDDRQLKEFGIHSRPPELTRREFP